MGRVRPFIVDDIPQVVGLSMRLFPNSACVSPQTQHESFHQVCFRNPWYDEALPSLVHEEENGRITGFLGVVPRRMSMHGQTMRVAVSQHLMVEPDRRSTLAGVQLLKTFLSGPQDLSMADMAEDISRQLWERLGGATALLYSLYWWRPLRPSCYVLSRVGRHRGLAPFARAAMPLCRVVDALAARIPRSPFRPAVPQAAAVDPTVETLLGCLSRFSEDQALRPEYDSHSLCWLLERVTQEKRYGALQRVVVQDAKQNILGWYLYYLNPAGMSKVLQIGARRHALDGVVDHLVYHAWQHGTIGLFGRLEPRLMNGASRKFGLVIPGSHWMLVHSRRPELLQTIQRGEAFLSHLEGDLELL